MTELLLVRHAHCDHVGRRLVGRLPDIHLSDQGRQQADTLAEQLRAQRIDAIVSSPLERAVETANAIAAPHQLHVTTDDDLVDIDFGDWTGASFDELAGDLAWTLFNTHRSSARIPGGECMADVQRRALRAVARIEDARPAARVVVVSHADVIRSIIAAARNLHLDALHVIDVEPASITPLTAAISAG